MSFRPAIVLKNEKGRTFIPEEISVRVEYWEGIHLLASGRFTLDNHKSDIIEQARSVIPERYQRRILTAEMSPNISPAPGAPLALIRFDGMGG